MKFFARAATLADSEILLTWRNDPLTRKQSREVILVSPTEHRDWLAMVLADPHRHLFIVETESGAPAGTVRFDIDSDSTVEVSITVSPHFRGKNFGSPMLLSAELALREQTHVNVFRAFIKRDNVASVRLFESAEYLPDQDYWWVKRMESHD